MSDSGEEIIGGWNYVGDQWETTMDAATIGGGQTIYGPDGMEIPPQSLVAVKESNFEEGERIVYWTADIEVHETPTKARIFFCEKPPTPKTFH